MIRYFCDICGKEMSFTAGEVCVHAYDGKGSIPMMHLCEDCLNGVRIIIEAMKEVHKC